eukprot:gene31410-40802_t
MEIARLSLPQLVSIISAIIYLCTYEQYYATYLFTCIVGMKLLVPSAVIFYTLSEGVITSKLKLRRWVFVLPLIALAIARIMTSYKILFPEYTIITTLVTIFFAIGVTLFVLVQSYWFLAFWRLYKVDSDLGLAETKELSFATILVVWLTVLPGRLLRKVAEVNESLLRLKREFVRYVSHEIRSPLNVACAGLEILKADLEALRAAGSVLDLLNDISFLELAVTPLKNLFASRLETYKYMCSKKDIALHIEDLAQASEYYSAAEADTDRDADVVAVHHQQLSLERDRNGTFSTVLYIDKFRPILKLEDDTVDKQASGYLCIEIVDNGAGIALENQSRVFHEFAQFNRNTLQGGGGSGLGLWICRNLAAMHGGAMHFRSDGEGLGSTFYVHLPVYNRRGDPEELVTTEENVVSNARRLAAIHPFDTNEDGDVVVDIEVGVKKMRVLIMDDSSANRSQLVAVLYDRCVLLALTLHHAHTI